MSNMPRGTTHTLAGGFVKFDEDGAGYVWDNRLQEWVRAKGADSAAAVYKFLSVAEKVEDEPTQTHDTVQNPKHYQLLPGVEVYDIRQALAAKATAAGVTLDQFSDYDRAVEYLLRMWDKNGVEDAQKAVWYLKKLVEKLNGSGS